MEQIPRSVMRRMEYHYSRAFSLGMTNQTNEYSELMKFLKRTFEYDYSPSVAMWRNMANKKPCNIFHITCLGYENGNRAFGAIKSGESPEQYITRLTDHVM